MAAINDLRVALMNMSKAESVDLDQARKNLRRSRELAIKFSRSDAELGKQVLLILTDAQAMVAHTAHPENYIHFVANECLGVINAIPDA